MWIDLCPEVEAYLRGAFAPAWTSPGPSPDAREVNRALYAALRAIHRKRGPAYWPQERLFAFCRAHDATLRPHPLWGPDRVRTVPGGNALTP